MAGTEFATPSDVTIGTSYTLIVEADALNYLFCGIQIKNTGGTNAFSGLELRTLSHSSGTEESVLTVQADYEPTLKHPLVLASTGIFTLAAGASGSLKMWAVGDKVLRWYAKVASGTTTASAKGNLK